MYEAYWQLEKKPFESGVDQQFYYPGEAHQGALLKLRYAVENYRGAAVLAGPTGSGKTTVVEALWQQLPEEFTPLVHLVFPDFDSRELLTYLADELGAPAPPNAPRYTADESVRRIERFLRSNAQQGYHAVVAIDEAHLLEQNGTLQTVRLLLNFTLDARPGLTLLLIGQSALLPQLSRTPDLDERIGAKALLRPLGLEESISYVNHRLSAAGAKRTIFEPAAIEALHELTSGIPRRINRLADLALVVGYADQLESIDADRIRSVCDELVAVGQD